jgi:iron complex outermembrane receptor protein
MRSETHHQDSQRTTQSRRQASRSDGSAFPCVSCLKDVCSIPDSVTKNASIDQSISLNLDGMQVSQGLAYQAGLFDVGQIEVLRGPQALFYGKSSPGGVVSLHSADPTNEFEFTTQGGFEAQQRQAQLIVSGPVTDTLKLRLASQYSAQNGYFENVAVGDPTLGGISPKTRDDAPEEDYIVRGTAIWSPSSAFDAKLKANYTKTFIDGNGGDIQVASCPGGTSSQVGVPFLDPAEDCVGDRVTRVVGMLPAAFPGIRNGGIPFQNVWQTYGTLEMNYHVLQDLTLTSVTGQYTLHQLDLINGNGSSLAGPTLAADNTFYRHDTTEELRLTSDFSTPVNFTTGAFVQSGGIHNDINLLGNTFLGFPPELARGRHQVGIRSYSLFGQVLWKIVPKVELATGARWSYESRTDTVTSTMTGTPVIVPVAVPQFSSYHLNPETALTYTPSDDLTLFVSYREASKSGSYDTTTIPSPGDDISYRDEGVRGVEGGLKTVLLDRRLHLDLTSYHYNYSNLQVGTNVITSQGGIVEKTLNAAASKVYGVELDGSYIVPAIKGLTVNGAATWNIAKYKNFNSAPCWAGQTIAEGCDQQLNTLVTPAQYTAQNLSDRPLVRAPKWSTNFGLNYETSVAPDTMMSFASNTLYSSSYYTDLILRSDTLQHSYFKTDASVALSNTQRTWEFAVIGHDLNDEITTGNCLHGPFANGVVLGSAPSGYPTNPGGAQDDVGCIYEPGRQVWLRVTLKPYALWEESHH